MYFIVGDDRKQYGPVPADLVRQWLREGRLNAQTLTLAAGTETWKPLAAFPEFAADVLPPVSAGATPGASGWALAMPELDVLECVSRAWNLVKDNFGQYFAGAALYLLIQIGVSMLQQIPRFGFVVMAANVLISPVLMAGVYWHYLKKVRGQPALLSDLFAGFQGPLGSLIVAQIICTLLYLACCLPGGAVAGISVFHLITHHAAGGTDILLISLGGLLIIIPAMFIGIRLFFGLIVIMDKSVGFKDGIATSWRGTRGHFWSLFGLLLLCGLINVGGVLACCIGIFFTMPVMFVASMFAYDVLFRGYPAAAAPAAQVP